jgi:hypothetical protein
MSQETTSTATSSNLEAQLANAMMAINALTTNMGALFNQVNTLTNSIGVMQACYGTASCLILSFYFILSYHWILSLFMHLITAWSCGHYYKFDSCLALLHTADSMPSHYSILLTISLSLTHYC